MASHTYIIGTVVGQAQGADVLVTVTGTADGQSFTISFWQSAVATMTLAQLKTFTKALIDAEVFPVLPILSPTLAGFAGGTFTQ